MQWIYNDEYQNVVWMMGPLHVEMAYMSAIGDWVDGSGWLEAFEKANISTTGRIESFLRGSSSITCNIGEVISKWFQKSTEFRQF